MSEAIEGYEVVEREFEEYRKGKSIGDVLKDVLTPEEREHLVKSFDIIGNVAIIDLPPELYHRKKEVARAIKEVHPSVRTVAIKVGPMEGEFRVPRLEVVEGDSLVTEYREHGVRMRLDVGKVYFSPRLSYERIRIARLVKEGEVVGVFFAGVGPFAFVIEKHARPSYVYAIEKNPVAARYLWENIALNKSRVIGVKGDVREVVPRAFRGTSDRVVMPMPKGGVDFLDVAVEAIRERGVIHVYAFGREEDPYSEVERKLEELGVPYRVLFRRKVSDYAPGIWRVVVDVEVEKV